jgi:hypothetical protein
MQIAVAGMKTLATRRSYFSERPRMRALSGNYRAGWCRPCEIIRRDSPDRRKCRLAAGPRLVRSTVEICRVVEPQLARSLDAR